jgi:hypothetical protein
MPIVSSAYLRSSSGDASPDEGKKKHSATKKLLIELWSALGNLVLIEGDQHLELGDLLVCLMELILKKLRFVLERGELRRGRNSFLGFDFGVSNEVTPFFELILNLLGFDVASER